MGANASGQFCKCCDYPLTGVGAAICPECGRAFDAADPGTFAARPGVRRRRWIRRGLYALGVIVLVELFAPSRVAKLTWSWPNADGVTATSETKWCLVAPRWLPIRYPRWSAARSTKQVESKGLVYSEIEVWRVGWCWAPHWGGGKSWAPGPIQPDGTVIPVGAPSDWAQCFDVQPNTLDKLCDEALDAPSDTIFNVHGLPLKSAAHPVGPPAGR